MTWRLPALVILGLSLVAGSACGQYPDLKSNLKVVNVLSGYYDDGVTSDGQNRLPSVTFQLKNEGAEPLSNIDLALSFWEVGADGENDSKQIRGIEGTALEPGATGEAMTVRASIGYKSPAARVDFFSLSRYRGFTVRVFAKYRGRTTPLGELKVDARLLPAARKDGTRP